jgi:hypothetical protein
VGNLESLPSWSWAAWHGRVRHIWNYDGVLHKLMGYDSRTLGSDIWELFIERNGVLERINRNEDAANPSQGLPSIISAEQYGMQPVGFLHQPVLHFLAYTVPAAAFNFRGGQIKQSDFDGDWTFSFGVPGNLAVRSMSNHREGLMLNIGRNISGMHSVVYCQTDRDVATDSDGDDDYPATWILDQKGRRCGILLDHEEIASVKTTKIEATGFFDEQNGTKGITLDYEDPTEDRFQNEKFRLILLSKSSTVPALGINGQGHGFNTRGQRVKLKNLPPTGNDWAIMNVLLVKYHEGPFVTRVGIAQIFGHAWEDAGPELLYFRLA